MPGPREISPSQKGLGDMSAAEFREAAHKVADIVADYLEQLESYDVLPKTTPGATRAALSEKAPAGPEPLDTILDDYLRAIQPNITHWQHPMFMAYFSSVASGPGILGEWLSAALNSNVMLWRNAPSSTELEQIVVAWLRDLMGLPQAFDGMLTDTASISSLLAVVAARHAVPELDARDRGLAGRPELGRLRAYASAEAHSSIEKAAIVAGIGRDGVRRIPVDPAYRMIPAALAAAIREDRASGGVPVCVVATLGTTSTTSIDPVAEIATICERERVWLHVDAAYGGAMTLVPDYRAPFAGWERADSIVVNPHKWMFTPFDASLLLFRDAERFRDAFSLVPEYLKTPEAPGVRNFNEYGIQLGRRFRALKLWMHLRWFGGEGMASRIRDHVRMANELASWVDASSDWERVAPVPMATVCLRRKPAGMDEDALDDLNRRILDRVNATGQLYLSHTKLGGRFVLRVAIGNPRQIDAHIRRCWEILNEAAAAEAFAR